MPDTAAERMARMRARDAKLGYTRITVRVPDTEEAKTTVRETAAKLCEAASGKLQSQPRRTR